MAAISAQGLLDTSVVIDLDSLPDASLPAESTIAAVTLAELSAGLHTTGDPLERAARAGRLQRAEAAWEPLPFDAGVARRYGHLVALVLASGRDHRPRRMDLMIAATAAENGLPLFTRNPLDFRGLEAAVTVVPV
jgi:predicted nucleic acid-binding protein